MLLKENVFLIKAGGRSSVFKYCIWNNLAGHDTDIKQANEKNASILNNVSIQIATNSLRTVAKELKDKRIGVKVKIKFMKGKVNRKFHKNTEQVLIASRRVDFNNFNQENICKIEGAFENKISVSQLDKTVKAFKLKFPNTNDNVVPAIFNTLFESINFHLIQPEKIQANIEEMFIDIDQVRNL